MDNRISTILAAVGLCALTACGPKAEVKSYNEGINIIPWPQHVEQKEGHFTLDDGTVLACTTPEAKTVAGYFASKMARSTGYDITVGDRGTIVLHIDTAAVSGDEAYRLDVTADSVKAVAG
ncbi:MAG TPA: glycoside hydrolase family 20 zincin-like fold domain-containing protein, partial [Candidatus Avibacteroides avistercoris]|nr:glycoside hydrolase family 20 zincin-like fold domain-containing protein [Candidatus Avibacteroides avistercoris]